MMWNNPLSYTFFLVFQREEITEKTKLKKMYPYKPYVNNCNVLSFQIFVLLLDDDDDNDAAAAAAAIVVIVVMTNLSVGNNKRKKK